MHHVVFSGASEIVIRCVIDDCWKIAALVLILIYFSL